MVRMVGMVRSSDEVQQVEGLRYVFENFDVKKTGLLRQTEATELLKTLGIEVRSVEERLALSDQTLGEKLGPLGVERC